MDALLGTRIACTVLLSSVLIVPATLDASTANLEIAIRPGSEAGGLNVRSTHCPGDVFDFRTCEGVVVGSKDFGLFRVRLPATPKDRIEAVPVKAAVIQGADAPNAMDESVWTDAAVWRIAVPAAWRKRDTLLRIDFVGDVARIYASGKLLADKFYNGQPFEVGLWRVPPSQIDTLELRVMPLHPSFASRLPAAMRPTRPSTKPRAELASVEALERRQLTLKVYPRRSGSIP